MPRKKPCSACSIQRNEPVFRICQKRNTKEIGIFYSGDIDDQTLVTLLLTSQWAKSPDCSEGVRFFVNLALKIQYQIVKSTLLLGDFAQCYNILKILNFMQFVSSSSQHYFPLCFVIKSPLRFSCKKHFLSTTSD